MMQQSAANMARHRLLVQVRILACMTAAVSRTGKCQGWSVRV